MMLKDGSLFIDGYLIISDLHIGIEHKIGLSRKINTEKMLNRLIQTIEETDPEYLVIAGDLKDSFRFEYTKALKDFIDEIFKKVRIIVTKGNHDNYLESIIKDKAKIVDFFETDSFIVAHGHKKISSNKLLILGDMHPIVNIYDEWGVSYRYKAFIEMKDKLILPAYNDITPGIDIFSGIEFRKNPNFTYEELEDSNIYVIDEEIVKVPFRHIEMINNERASFKF